jgi:hypothetical protein
MKDLPLSEKQISRLVTSIKWSEGELKFSKAKRLEAIQQIAGYHYSPSGSCVRSPVPLLSIAIQTYVRMLAAHAPQVMISTVHNELRPAASNFELALNQLPEEIGLATTLRRLVQEALVAPFGIVKVGLHSVGTALNHEYGQPFVDLVSWDDYFLDMSAKRPDLIDYEGNQYWLDYEEVMDSSFIDPSERRDLKPDAYSVVGPEGERRAEELTANSSADEYRERVWLRDVWLPREQVLLTMGVKSNKVLRCVEWKGPENGPYPKLWFNDIPGNLLPLPPVSGWIDLHELSNTLFRKVGHQGSIQKTVLGFPGGDDSDVQNFQSSTDGDGIRYSGAEPRKLTVGGADPNTVGLFTECKGLFSYIAGNIDMLGGLSPQSPTIGQDRLLSQAASTQLRDMADRVTDTMTIIFKMLGYYEWHDPVKKRKFLKTVPQYGIQILKEWDRSSRKGKLEQYDFKVDVYSLQDNSPQIMLQKLTAILQNFILPLMPQIQQSGGTFNAQKLLSMVARYSNFQELDELVMFSEQLNSGAANTAQSPSKLPQAETGVAPQQQPQQPNATVPQGTGMTAQSSSEE